MACPPLIFKFLSTIKSTLCLCDHCMPHRIRVIIPFHPHNCSPFTFHPHIPLSSSHFVLTTPLLIPFQPLLVPFHPHNPTFSSRFILANPALIPFHLNYPSPNTLHPKSPSYHPTSSSQPISSHPSPLSPLPIPVHPPNTPRLTSFILTSPSSSTFTS